MRTSIKYKAVIFLAFLLLLALGISSILVLQGIGRNQQLRYENQLARQAELANIYIAQDFAKAVDVSPEQLIGSRGYELARQIGQMTGTHVVIFDMTGKEAGNSSPGLLSPDTSDTMQYALEEAAAYQISDQELYYLAPIEILDKRVGVVQFFYSLAEEQEFYNTIRGMFMKIASLIFLMTFVLGTLYFGRITKAILSLKLAVDNVKAGKYQEIPALSRKDELGDLRQGIFYMSCQIEESLAAMDKEQQKLTKAVEKLKALDQQQREFIGNVTHEFKTPLTVIKAYIDLIDMYPGDEKLSEEGWLSINRETLRLYEMVEKTLQLAAIEKYDFELDMQPVALQELLNEICSRMEGKIQKNNLVLHRDIKPMTIFADKESMSMILINLIDNAIKYNNSKGHINVKSYLKDSFCMIEVQDSGIGIPDELRNKVFQPFYTVDKNRSRQYGGIGLGLALVKQLTEKQGGTIEIAERSKDGTTFVLKFPLHT